MGVDKDIVKVYEARTGNAPQNNSSKDLLGGYIDVAYLPTQKVRQPMKYAKLTQWFFAPILGQPRNVDINQLRNFCQSTFVKICTQTIIDEVCSLKWKILPIDEENADSYSKDDIKKITTFLNNPNRNDESLSHILRTYVRDILELDAGVIVKVFNSGDYEEDVYEEIPLEMYRAYGTKDQKLTVNGDEDYEIKKVEGIIHQGKKNLMIKSKMRELGTKVKTKLENGTIKKFVERLPYKEIADDKFELTEIYARDGGSFLKDVDLFGINYGYWQYSFMQPSYMPRWFDKKEIIYTSLNPRSEHAYGWAPIQSIMEIVETINNSVLWNRDFFYNKAIPDGIVDFGNMDEDTMKGVKADWQKDIKGKAHRLLFVSNPRIGYSEGSGGAQQQKSVTFTSFQKTPRELEFLGSQKWHSNIIMSEFKCSPAELAIDMGTKTKAIQEGQERVHVRRAVRPILAEIEYAFNNEIVTEFFNPNDPKGKTGGLQFKFDYIDPVDEAKQKENEIKDLDAGVITINEVRRKRGLDEVEWGNKPFNKMASAMDDNDENKKDNIDGKPDGATKDSKGKDKGGVKKAASFDADTGGEGTASSAMSPTKPQKKKIKDDKKSLEVIEMEYKGYSDYLENVMKQAKKKVYKALETEFEIYKGVKTSYTKNYLNKSFTGFISKMVNTMFNITFNDSFYRNVEKYIKHDLQIGVKDAEEALNQDIVLKDIDSQALMLTEQQINGYTMFNGEKFVGIKGAVDSVEKQIINNLNEAISKADVTMDDLTKAVDDAWGGRDGIDENRTLMIARTETSRIVNKGKLQGAHDSGMEVKKKWVVYPHKDKDACDELAKHKAIELDEWFVYKDLKYQSPPQHPSCRCQIELVEKK